MNLTENSTLLYIAYACFFALATLFSLLTNGLLLRFSKTLGDHDEHRRVIRWTSTVKPSVGGFSFYMLFLLSLSMYGLFHFSGNEYMSRHLLGIVFSINVSFLIGLADDAYNTYPILKFSGQLLCGIFLVATDTMIHATGIYSIDVLLTLMWVVGLMNSINMLDNMDGLSGTVSLGILFGCLLVLLVNNNLASFYSVMLLGVSGAITGFLYFNWHPARIYMGDMGSQFLGTFLSGISIQVLWPFHEAGGATFQLHQFLIPLMAFSVPLIDTTTVFIRRIARGQSPFVGGKDHISHHFVYAGLKDKQVTYLLGGFSFLSGLMAAMLVWWYDHVNMDITPYFYIYLLLLFILVQFFYAKGKKRELFRKNEALHQTSIS